MNTTPTDRHMMIRTDRNGEQSLFECTVDQCGRRLVFDHVDVRLIVLTPGDPAALHQGSTGLVVLAGTVERREPVAPYPV
jgi:hypothetical protein